MSTTWLWVAIGLMAAGLAVAVTVVMPRSNSGSGYDDRDRAELFCSMEPGITSIYSDEFENCVTQKMR